MGYMYIDALLMGEGMAYGSLPFPDTSYLVPDAGYIYSVWNYCVGHCLCTYTPPYDVSVWLSLNKKRNGQVTSGLLYMRFTCYTKNNQQECPKPSNWFSLWCMGPWMNHWPPVWWSTFRFTFIIVSWRESSIWWRGIFLLNSCPYSCFMLCPSFSYYFPYQVDLLSDSNLYWHFPQT